MSQPPARKNPAAASRPARSRRPEPEDAPDRVQHAEHLMMAAYIAFLLAIIFTYCYFEISDVMKGRKESTRVLSLVHMIYRVVGLKGLLACTWGFWIAGVATAFVARGRLSGLRSDLGGDRFDEIRLEVKRREHEQRSPEKEAPHLESIETMREQDTRNRAVVWVMVAILVVGLWMAHRGYL